MRGIHRWPVNSPHKGPVTRKMIPSEDVIMGSCGGICPREVTGNDMDKIDQYMYNPTIKPKKTCFLWCGVLAAVSVIFIQCLFHISTIQICFTATSQLFRHKPYLAIPWLLFTKPHASVFCHLSIRMWRINFAMTSQQTNCWLTKIFLQLSHLYNG